MSAKLQARYENAQLPPVPWMDDQLFPIEYFFVDLSLVTKDKSGKVINEPIELNQILQSNRGKPPCRVLIEGGPGYGKTTITKKIAYDWATQSSGYLEAFDLVFMIRLRTLQSDLLSVLIEEGKVKGVNKTDIQDAILSHPEKVLLILDGFDEMNVTLQFQFLDDPSFLLMTIILTSRPAEVLEIRQMFQKNILLRGISDSNRQRFVKKYFHSLDLPDNNYSELQNYLKDNRLDDLCACPLLLSLMCLLVTGKTFSLPQTKTELFQDFIDFIVKRSLRKSDLYSSTDVDIFGRKGKVTPVRVAKVLKSFGNYILQTLGDNKVLFSKEEILLASQNDPLVLNLGLVYKNDSITKRKVVTYVEPIHITFLEFLAGYAMAEGNTTDNFKPLASSHPLVFVFMAGLAGNRFPQMPQPRNASLLINMLIETQDPMKYMKFIRRNERNWLFVLRRFPSGLRTVAPNTISQKITSHVFREVEREYTKYVIQNENLLSLNIRFTEQGDSSEDFELKKYIPEQKQSVMIPELTIYISKDTLARDVVDALSLLRPKILKFSTTEEFGKCKNMPKLSFRRSFYGEMLNLVRKENLHFSALKFLNASFTRKDIKCLVKLLINSKIEDLFLHGLNAYSRPIYLNLTPLFSILEHPVCLLRELHLQYVNIFQKDVDNLCQSAGRSSSLSVLEFCTTKNQNIELAKLCNNGQKQWDSITLQFFQLILPDKLHENIFQVRKLVSHNTVSSDQEQKDRLKITLESCGIQEVIIS